MAKLSINEIKRLKKILECKPKRRRSNKQQQINNVRSTSDHMQSSGFATDNLNNELLRAQIQNTESRNKMINQIGYDPTFGSSTSPLMLAYNNTFQEKLMNDRTQTQRQVNFLYNKLFEDDVESVYDKAEELATDNNGVVSQSPGSDYFESEGIDIPPVTLSEPAKIEEQIPTPMKNIDLSVNNNDINDIDESYHYAKSDDEASIKLDTLQDIENEISKYKSDDDSLDEMPLPNINKSIFNRPITRSILSTNNNNNNKGPSKFQIRKNTERADAFRKYVAVAKYPSNDVAKLAPSKIITETNRARVVDSYKQNFIAEVGYLPLSVQNMTKESDIRNALEEFKKGNN